MVWRQIGDIIDSHISWPRKHFFASKIVLRVIWLLSIIFVASVPCLRVVVSFVRVIVLSVLRGTAGLSSSRLSLSMVVTSLRRFHVFASSFFPFVDFDTYKIKTLV